MILLAFDARTKSAREIWRQMQATRFYDANPKLKINTNVMGTADPPEVVFKFVDDTEVRLLALFCLKITFCVLTPRSVLPQLRNDSTVKTSKRMKSCLMSTYSLIA
jgi:hypothetical protein